jgi:hypothetical protein
MLFVERYSTIQKIEEGTPRQHLRIQNTYRMEVDIQLLYKY